MKRKLEDSDEDDEDFELEVGELEKLNNKKRKLELEKEVEEVEKEKQQQIAKSKASLAWEELKKSTAKKPTTNILQQDTSLNSPKPTNDTQTSVSTPTTVQPQSTSTPTTPTNSRFAFTALPTLLQSAQAIKQTLSDSPDQTVKKEQINNKENKSVTEKKSTKPKSNIEDILESLKPKKISTITKSKIDWDEFKQKEGIEDELALHNKDGFLDKQEFKKRIEERVYERELQERIDRKKNTPKDE